MSDILVVTEEPEVEVIKTTEAASEVIVFNMVEKGPQGIQGVPGVDGLPGVNAVGAIPGSAAGDFLRWNEGTGDWEAASEPIEFKGLVLTPALASLIDAEGALYYNSALKSVLVCTDV